MEKRIIYEDEALTLKEFAKKLKVTERTVYRYLTEGKISGFRVGNGPWRINLSEIRRLAEVQNKEIIDTLVEARVRQILSREK